MLGGLLLLSAGCKKATPEPAAPAPAPVPAPEPEPEPEPEPASVTSAVVPPAEREHNADFTAAITFADGTNQKGEVVRVERTEDWFGEDGWTGDPAHLKVTLEGAGTEIEAPWTDIARIDITYGTTPGDVDCTYDSSYDPAMYMCVNRTTTKVKTKDGKSWTGVDRHKWMFVFSSGEAPEFYLHKLSARQQEAEVPDLGTVNENTALYQKLQDDLATARKGKVPTTLTITAP
jgi:hypothetical protein